MTLPELLRRRRTPKVDVPWELSLLKARLMREITDMHERKAFTANGANLARAALARTIDDFMLYAEVGRDRKKLDMEWVDKAEAAVRETWGLGARY